MLIDKTQAHSEDSEQQEKLCQGTEQAWTQLGQACCPAGKKTLCFVHFPTTLRLQ